jgi:hypothetical protein
MDPFCVCNSIQFYRKCPPLAIRIHGMSDILQALWQKAFHTIPPLACHKDKR